MRLSRRFRLGKSQFELDFVDIDPKKDKRVFLDPYFLAKRSDAWSMDATRSIQSFFAQFLTFMRSNQDDEARQLFENLQEPNETCLGLSKGRPRGHGVGETSAESIFESLRSSRAVQTGLLHDLEDARIFVPGIGKDLTSDMTTNIIRGHLLEYTVAQCELNNIPLSSNIPSGWMWDRQTRAWTNGLTNRLVVDDRPLLLVPKAVVSFVKAYTDQAFRQHFVLNFLQHEHLRMNSVLVKTRRRRLRDVTPRRYVTKKDVVASEPEIDKEYLARFTEAHPGVFAAFREETAARLASLGDGDLTVEDRNEVIDHLVTALTEMPSGNDAAGRYHNLIIGILELLTYPDLMSPIKEVEIHDGRKRIDITCDNAAAGGFFFRLHNVHHIPCSYVMVECKNYGREVANPELDQMAGRFSPNRGRFGMIVCRTIDDMPRFLRRCADTEHDDRGTIVPLVDADLIVALTALRGGHVRPLEGVLSERFRSVRLA